MTAAFFSFDAPSAIGCCICSRGSDILPGLFYMAFSKIPLKFKVDFYWKLWYCLIWRILSLFVERSEYKT